MPQAVLRVQAQHQGAGKHRLAAARPLLKRVVMRLQWRAVKRVERQATKLLRQRVAYLAAPAVQRIGQAVLGQGRRLKVRPHRAAHIAGQPQHRGMAPIGQGDGFVGLRAKPAAQMQAMDL